MREAAPSGQRGIVAGLTLLAIAMAAAVVHVASLLVVPRAAPEDAYARLAAATPEGRAVLLPPGGSADAALPGRDPSVATAVCRYDLDRGPLRISAAIGDAAFLALTLHGRTGVAFYGLDDRASDDRRLELVVMTPAQIDEARARDGPDAPVRDVRVAAPERQGFAMVDALPRLGGEAEARRALASVSCRVEPLL